MKPGLFTASCIHMLFVAALGFTLFMALDPHPPKLPFDRLGDKFEHMLAFFVLAVLARLGFRGGSDWAILVRLSILGALIEVVQAMPFVHRDCEFNDWLVDTATVAAVLLAMRLARKWR